MVVYLLCIAAGVVQVVPAGIDFAILEEQTRDEP